MSSLNQSAASAPSSPSTPASSPSPSGSSPASPGPGHSPTSPGVSEGSDSIVVSVDILLLCVLGVFVLFALPRAVARLSRATEWKRGLFLYGPTKSAPGSSSGTTSERKEEVEARGPTGSYGGGQTSNTTLRLCLSGIRPGGPPPPKRMPSWSARFPGNAWVLGTQVIPGYSIGRVSLLLAWLGVMLYAGLHDSNPFSDPGRAGIVVVGQLPLVFVLGTKNNVVGTLIGRGYERVGALVPSAEVACVIGGPLLI